MKLAASCPKLASLELRGYHKPSRDQQEEEEEEQEDSGWLDLASVKAVFKHSKRGADTARSSLLAACCAEMGPALIACPCACFALCAEPALTSLNYENALVAALPALAELTTLQSLHLRLLPKRGERPLSALARVLPALTRLSKLYVNAWFDAGAEAACTWQLPPSLTDLRLDTSSTPRLEATGLQKVYLKLHDAGIRALLASNKQLSSLLVREHGGVAGRQPLETATEEAIAGHAPLRKLWLTSPVSPAFFKRLPALTQLQELLLQAPHEAAARDMTALLAALPHIESFTMGARQGRKGNPEPLLQPPPGERWPCRGRSARVQSHHAFRSFCWQTAASATLAKLNYLSLGVADKSLLRLSMPNLRRLSLDSPYATLREDRLTRDANSPRSSLREVRVRVRVSCRAARSWTICC